MDSKTVALGVIAGLSGCLSVGALVLANNSAETVNRLRKEVDYLMAQTDVLALRNDLMVSELAAYKESMKEWREAGEAPDRDAENVGQEAEVIARTEAEAERQLAEIEAAKQTAEDAGKKAEVIGRAETETEKQLAEIEAAKTQAAEDARKRADAEIEAAVRAADEKRARVLAERHLREPGRSSGQDLDNLIIGLVRQAWRQPPSSSGLSVEVAMRMLPDGTVTSASLARSSGNPAFDDSAVAAVRNLGRIPEIQQLDRATFDQMYRQRRLILRADDLAR